MENGLLSDYDDDIVEIVEIRADPDEQHSSSSSPILAVTPGTPISGAVGNPTVFGEPIVVDSSDDMYGSVDGDEGDDDTSDDQQRNLTVTFRSEETSEEIATAILIMKRHDNVDTFLPLVGAILRSMKSERLKVTLMDEISRFLIDAKTEEIERLGPPRLQ